jgi:hypothetical protein
VDDCPLFECFTYYVNYQSVSVDALGEPVGTLLTALENEDLRKERLKQINYMADSGFAHLPSVDVAIDILLMNIARGA